MRRLALAGLLLLATLPREASASPRPRLSTPAPRAFTAFVRHLLRSPEGARLTRTDAFWHELGAEEAGADELLLGIVHELLLTRGRMTYVRAFLQQLEETPADVDAAAEQLARTMTEEERTLATREIAGAKARAMTEVIRRVREAPRDIASWKHSLGELEAYLREFRSLRPYHPTITQSMADSASAVEAARERLMREMASFDTGGAPAEEPLSPLDASRTGGGEAAEDIRLARPSAAHARPGNDLVLAIQRRIDTTEAAIMDRRERPLLAPTYLWFFLTGAAMNLFIPLRNVMVTTKVPPEFWSLVPLGSVLVAFVAVAFYRSFKHLPRPTLMKGALLILGATILPWGLIALNTEAAGLATSLAFTFWSDTFSVMALWLPLTFFYDAFGRGASKRKGPYLIIALCAGSAFGAGLGTLAVWLLGLDKLALLPIGFAVFAGAFAASRWAESRALAVAPKPPEPAAVAEPKPSDGPLKTIVKHPFTALIALSVLFEKMMPALSDYLLKTMSLKMFPDETQLALFNTLYQLSSNLLGVGFAALVLLLLKLKRGGMIIALASLPLVHLLGFVGFSVFAAAWGAVFHNGLESALRISSFKLGVQTTYTEETPAIREHVRPFIDNIVYRAALIPVGLLLSALVLMGANVVQGVYIAGMIVSAIALPAAIVLGRLWERRKAAREAAQEAGAAKGV